MRIDKDQPKESIRNNGFLLEILLEIIKICLIFIVNFSFLCVIFLKVRVI